MITQSEIQKIANRLSIRDTQVEKDYVIGWILYGISENDYLKNKLIFKGGTALRKIHFKEYRLSEDLDFTFNGKDFSKDSVDENFTELNEWVYKNARIKIAILDQVLHKTGNYNFYLGYIGPLGGSGANKSIKVDIANDELICNTPVEWSVYNEYSDLKTDYKLLCYSLAEIIPEKMRSLIQRSMPRDLYDIWYLLENEGLNIEDHLFDFRKKTELKKLNPDELVSTVLNKEDRFKKEWNTNLVNQIKEIPNFDEVWRSLGKHWRKFEKESKK